MDKYILIGSVTGIGGWQLYINARASFLQEEGINCFIIYSDAYQETGIKLKNLVSANKMNVVELRDPPYVFSVHRRLKVVDRIRQFIDYKPGDNIFIESTSSIYSFWGEVIAKELNGTNYSYLLHSHFSFVPRSHQLFFENKYVHDLISGQTELTLPELFSGYIDIDKNDTRSLSATWEDPISKDDYVLATEISGINELKEKGVIVLAYFGTLEKPHFAKVCNVIREYVNSHKDSKYCFLSVGSSKDGRKEKYQENLFLDTSNCISKNIQELYPVPEKLFALMDLCVSSWGSATVAGRVCQRTIRLMNDTDTLAHGIIGITLKTYPYYKIDNIGIPLLEMIEKVLDTDDYNGVEYIFPPTPPDYRCQMRIISKTLNPFSRKKQDTYYPVGKIKPANRNELELFCLYHTIGYPLTAFIRKKMHVLKNR